MNEGINWDAYTDFWYWINERHRISLKKWAGEPKPWTEDKIFQEYRFCNVFRGLDTQTNNLHGSLLMLTNVYDVDETELIFHIMAFRAFNWDDSYVKIGGDKPFDGFDAKEKFSHFTPGEKVTSAAYMMRGRTSMPKALSICMTLEDAYKAREDVARDALSKGTLEGAYDAFKAHNFWGWGEFFAYQMALDMTLPGVGLLENPPDINEWCEFGPGAKKGLREIWPDIPLKKDWMIAATKHLLADQVKYREEHVPELTLQDIEFSLCELSKYRRIKTGGHMKARYDGKN